MLPPVNEIWDVTEERGGERYGSVGRVRGLVVPGVVGDDFLGGLRHRTNRRIVKVKIVVSGALGLHKDKTDQEHRNRTQ